MTNFQFLPYTLIAVGIINAVYRKSDSTSLNFSYLLILFGSAIFLARRNESTQKFMDKPVINWVILAISGFLILLTILN